MCILIWDGKPLAGLSQCNVTIFMQTAVPLRYPLNIITPHVPCPVGREIAIIISITIHETNSILEVKAQKLL